MSAKKINKKILKDPSLVRRLVLGDGLPFPMLEEEVESEAPPQNIRQIGYNVQRNIASHFDAMDEDLQALGACAPMSDYCFDEDYMTTWRPTRWAYHGDKPRKLRRPFKNFLRTKLHIKGIRSDEELLAEDAAIKEILARYPEKQVKVTSAMSLFSHVAASGGVTASQSEILRYLKVNLLKHQYQQYRETRKSFVKKLKHNRKVVERNLEKLEKDNKKMFETLEKAVPLKAEPEELVKKRKLVLANHLALKKSVKTGLKDYKKHLETFMKAFWEFKLMRDDCSYFMAEFLSTPLKNFCKLNPTKPKK